MTKLIQLNYSGGKASEALLHMVLRGEIEVPAKLIVCCANPGMEHPITHIHTRAMEVRCRAAGIPFLRANVDLYNGILEAKRTGKTRFDFPAFFTRNRETGKIGMLKQGCTAWCKIAPMDRLARHWMDANLGISKKSKRLGEKIMCKWIGFTFDEVDRIKPHPCPKYVFFDYPLANRKITSAGLLEYYHKNHLAVPPRSVCAGCFANDSEYFRDMFLNRPECWMMATKLDEAIRDLSQFGVRDECFIYAGCIPLIELARIGFPNIKQAEERCHSGHCFI